MSDEIEVDWSELNSELQRLRAALDLSEQHKSDLQLTLDRIYTADGDYSEQLRRKLAQAEKERDGEKEMREELWENAKAELDRHILTANQRDALAVQLKDMTNDRIHYQRELAMAMKTLKERTKERDALREALGEVMKYATIPDFGSGNANRTWKLVSDALKQQKRREGDSNCPQSTATAQQTPLDDKSTNCPAATIQSTADNNAESQTSDPLALGSVLGGPDAPHVGYNEDGSPITAAQYAERFHAEKALASATPRTDEAWAKARLWAAKAEMMRDWATKLEEELTAAKEEMKQYKKSGQDWNEKTEWIQDQWQELGGTLGEHRADIITRAFLAAKAKLKERASEAVGIIAELVEAKKERDAEKTEVERLKHQLTQALADKELSSKAQGDSLRLLAAEQIKLSAANAEVERLKLRLYII